MRRAVMLLSMTCLMLLTGCFKAAQIPELAPISITLTSSTLVALGPNQPVQIMASVYDQSRLGVTWSIAPLNFGTLTQETSTSVTYIAPTNFTRATTLTITATSITNPAVTASMQVSTSPISVAFLSLTTSLPLAAQSLNPGDQLMIFPVVSNDTNNGGVAWSLSPSSGAGSLSGLTPFSATYVAPPTVSTPISATITATVLASSSAVASVQVTVFPAGAGSNVAAVSVDGGPVPGQVNWNQAFTSATICSPGSVTACQTVDGLLVDTGSYGLRILQSEMPLLKLPILTNESGDTLENCAEQPNGSYLWGPVSKADVYIAGEAAVSLLVQVVSSSPAVVPDGCSNGSDLNQNTPQLLGANGILGVGPEPTDCTLSGVNYCDGSSQPAPPNVYYACLNGQCATTDSPVVVALQLQITNPIVGFADNNGVILQLPRVSGEEASVTGTMTFGIATSNNNSLGSATIFTVDSNDNFTTVYEGQTLTNSFIDSGANALYFPDSLPACKVNPTLYCPTSTVDRSAKNIGATQGQSTVSFNVGNADDLLSTYPEDAVFSDLGGAEPEQVSCSGVTDSCAFIWGLPFFYGRTVFTALDGATPPGTSVKGPWWAY